MGRRVDDPKGASGEHHGGLTGASARCDEFGVSGEAVPGGVDCFLIYRCRHDARDAAREGLIDGVDDVPHRGVARAWGDAASGKVDKRRVVAIAKVGAMTEWPAWHPTPSEISRLGVPTYVAPGPDNPMGSRAIYLYSGGKDTLFRIHGTNQPEYIGASISSGCGSRFPGGQHFTTFVM